MIEVKDVRMKFRRQEVLRGIELSIRKGERFVIIGRSGGGKSVLLRIIAGLLKPTSGKVVVEGQDWAVLSERELLPVRRKMGILFQGAALFDSMTVFENVAFPLMIRREHAVAEIEKRVLETLKLVDLEKHGHKKPSEISGGMRKRAGLARAIVDPPDIMLYDEPTAGLDPVIADSINNLILKMSLQLRITTILVTHDMTSAFKVGERIAMLHEGKFLESGTPAEIQKSSNPVVQNFIQGHSDQNVPELE